MVEGNRELPRGGGRGMVEYLERTEGKPPKWDIQENLMEAYENFMEPIVKHHAPNFWTIMVVTLQFWRKLAIILMLGWYDNFDTKQGR